MTDTGPFLARFFVTRIGFLRSTKRVLALSKTHFCVLDPDADVPKPKECWPLKDVKEITMSPDLPDKGFSILIGSTPESYSCRQRAEFLSAYYNLREQSIAGDQSGQTFNVVKLSTTRSTQAEPVKIDVLVAVRSSSFDRLDSRSRETVASMPLLDIVKIQKMRDDPSSLVVYFKNNRMHRYWCDERDALIQAIGTNLSTLLFVSLRVEDVDSSWEFDALTATRDELTPVVFEMPMHKISKTSKEPQPRMLALTTSALLERDPSTKRTLSSNGIGDIFNIVVEADGSKFAIEYKDGRTKHYQCRPCVVRERSSEVGVGFDLKGAGALGRPAAAAEGAAAAPPAATTVAAAQAAEEVVGSNVDFSAAAARSVMLCNLFELCAMNKVAVAVAPSAAAPLAQSHAPLPSFAAPCVAVRDCSPPPPLLLHPLLLLLSFSSSCSSSSSSCSCSCSSSCSCSCSSSCSSSSSCPSSFSWSPY
jgi:hypothetical protein